MHRILTKTAFFLSFLGFTQTGFAQVIPPAFVQGQHKLVADNGRHHKQYPNLKLLKIRFLDEGGEEKVAKGKLVILNDAEIQLIPFGKKPIVTIGTDSILSVTVVHRKGRVASLVYTAIGVVTTGTGILYGGNLVGFFLVLYGISSFYVAAALPPATLIVEWFQVHSVKKGYRFYIAP